MALIKCPECGKEISDKASNCPNCGYYLQENKKIKVSVKVPLVVSMIYTISVFIYANDYLWNALSIIMLIVGMALICLMLFAKKLERKIHQYLFTVIYVIGTFIFAFGYNISRMSLDFIDGNFFSSQIYSGSLGIFLAIFQVISVVAIILLCMTTFIPKISTKYALIALFVSGIVGLVFNIYDKVYLEGKWGTASYSTFYIWLGITTFCFFFTGVTYLLIDKVEDN